MNQTSVDDMEHSRARWSQDTNLQTPHQATHTNTNDKPDKQEAVNTTHTHTHTHKHNERDKQGTGQGVPSVRDLVRCSVKTKACSNTALGAFL